MLSILEKKGKKLKSWESLDEIINCPICKRDLVSIENEKVCENFHRFSKVEGIVDFRNLIQK